LKSIKLNLAPAQIVILSFAILISSGTLLLLLPAATISGNISLVDALFTATSATCVTGLIVVDTGSYFTPFGQMVILSLIQLGGLGIMSFSTFFVLMVRGRVSLKERLMVNGVYTPEPWEDFFHLLRMVLLLTFGVEAVGAFFLFFSFSRQMSPGAALYCSCFHSISAFCNAGFSIFSDSFARFKDNSLINIVMPLLITIGGIGFAVVIELLRRGIRREPKRKSLSLHTKLTVVVSLLLTLIAAVCFFFLEKNGTLANLSLREQVFTSIFQGVTPRTAGFSSVNFGRVGYATSFLFTILMFIGASPGSTGGGVKTTTIAVVLTLVLSQIKRSEQVNIFHRTINKSTIDKAVGIILASAVIITFFTLALLITEDSISHHDFSLRQVVFEAVSAFGTVGLSTGITSKLSQGGKILITLLMFVGRLGPLTFFLTLARGGPLTRFSYPEENVMLG
jgi:trk system potassium uptake protein TrkH